MTRSNRNIAHLCFVLILSCRNVIRFLILPNSVLMREAVCFTLGNCVMELQRDISNLSNALLVIRIKSLENLSALFASEDIKPPLIKRVAREILYCLLLSQFQEKIWRASLWQYFKRLMSTPFPLELECFILEILSERIPIANHTQLFNALQVLLFIMNSDSARKMPDWVPQAVTLVGLVIETNATSQPEGAMLSKSTNEVLLFLQRSSSFVEICTNLWSSQCLPAVALVLSHPSLAPQTHADQILQASLQSILNGSMKQPSIGVLQTFAPFLATTTQSEWDESYSPSLSKLIKKSPENSASVVSLICSSVRVDLSLFVESSFLAPAIKMLKSSQPSTREAALLTIFSITQKCSAVSPLLALLTALVDALSGKVPGSALTLEYQKIAILDAISKCVSVFNRYDMASSSSSIDQPIISLLLCIEKEPDDHIKFLEASVASSLVQSLQSVPAVVLDAVATGIGKRKSPMTTSALILFVARLFETSGDIVRSCQSLLGHATLLNTLGSIVKDAMKKTGVNLDAILSFGILSEINCHILLPASIFDLNKMAGFLGRFNSENFLWNSSVRQSLYLNQTSNNGLHLLSSFSVVALAKSLGVLCRMRRQDAAGPQSLSRGEIDLLLFCTHFPGRLVLDQIKPWVVEIVETVENASFDLLFELMRTLSDASSDRERKESEVKKNFKSLPTEESTINSRDQLHFAYVPPSRLRDAVSLFLTQSSPARNVVQVLLLAAHPYLSPSYSRSSTNMKLFLNRMNLSLDNVREILSSDGTLGDFLSQLFSSDSSASRHCVLGVLLLLFYVVGFQDLAVSELSKIITVCLQTDEISNFSEEEISVFLDPTLLTSRVSKALSVDDIKITNADRKKSSARGTRRGQFGADFIEDDDWAEQVKREKAKKILEAKIENSPEIEEARAKTAQIIAKVDSANVSSLRAIKVIDFLADPSVGNIGDPHDTLLSRTCHLIIPQLILLIRYPLLRDEVNRCLDRVVFVLVDDEMKRFAQMIANSLRVTGSVINRSKAKHVSDDRIFSELLEFSGPIVKTIKELHVLASRPNYLISSKSFQVLFPLFRGLFTLKALVPGCEYAFLVLDKFWQDVEADSTSRPLLRYFIETCLVVLSRFRVSPPADRVLVRVISSTTLTPMEWSPILSSVGLLNAESSIRKTCLLGIMESLNRGRSAGIGRNPLVVSRMWVVCHDSDEEVKHLAVQAWEKSQMSLSEAFMTSLCPLLQSQELHVALAAARAIAGGILRYPHLARPCIETLVQIFMESLPEKENAPPPPASLMKASLPIRLPGKKVEDTKVSVRVAIAASFEAIGSLRAFDKEATTTEELLKYLLAFLLEHGVTDTENLVRDPMVTAGRVLLDNYGDSYCESIIQVLENTLNQESRPDEDVTRFDHRHEAAVVLLGAAGKHLSRDDPHLINILESLVKALSTPVASIQRAVADCLVSIVQVLKTDERMNEYLGMLIKKTLNGETYGDRRGSAFGVSAFVKGLGIPSIKNHDIVNRLKDECASGSISSRQGSLFVFELLSERLGMLFEPYVITIMPVLLKCFSHSSDHVREAAQAAAKTIMAKLSAHGVKQVLTPILSSLPAETAWKSKQEALKLLGTMAFCAPKQLATSLPQIIPGIIEASLDGHPKVKESAKIALVDISSVIRNPEVSSLSGILIAALTEPANKTKAALEALLECEFMHSIDAPSLAILIPILARALKDRGGDLKRKSAIILGNMCSMINDAKIFIPYLPQVVPGLQEVLLDPIPDVRATSAKALGSLMGGVGENELPDLIPWLIRTLKTESSPVERSGAAQGLAEICLSLPEARIEQIIRDSMTLRSHSSHSAREGLLWLLTFLPSVLGEPFSAYISATLPVVLSGLSDDSEGVREVALRAGQVFVTSHGRAHTRDVLHPLLSGMFDEDWRIRESSLTLLGELLYLVGDTKAVGLTDLDNDDEDQSGSTSRVTSIIRAHIGEDLTDSVLSSLYIVRSDNSSSVRQIALQVWKSIVSNTPKTLREIMPSLVDLLIRKLSSESNDQQVVAGRALGDLVRKLGDHVLPLVIPYLQQGLQSAETELRQGVCLGLAEILRAASQKQIETYVETLVPALQEALCDDSEHVRSLASQAFHALMKAIGEHAVEAVVPILLAEIQEEFDESDLANESSALRGLRSIVALKPRDLLEYLLPILTQHPIQPSSSYILGVVCQSASASIHYHFSTLIPLLIQELIQMAGDESNQSAFTALRAAVASIVGSTSNTGVNFLVSELGRQIEHESNMLCRMWGCLIAADFFRNCSADYSDYIPVMLKYLLSRSADLEIEVLEGLLAAMTALASVVPVESLASHMEFIRSCLSLTASDAKHRPGRTDLFGSDGTVLLPLFRLPKALEPFLPIYIHCLMNGAPETREVAADGLGELISMTDTVNLKPYLIKTTGPLIRVVGDRYPSSVKYAILQTLCILLDKGGVGLKAFVPQLQTTFVKSLSDPAKQVRTKGASALGLLMPMSTRLDPLLNELCQGSQQAESHAIRASLLQAISTVLDAGGEKASEAATDRISQVVLNCLTADDEQVRSAAAEVASSLGALLPSVGVCDLLFEILALDSSSASGWAPVAGKTVGCGALLRTAGDRSLDARSEALQFLENGLNDERAAIKTAVCSALSLMVAPPTQTKSSATEHKDLAKEIIAMFLSPLTMFSRGEYSLETRRSAVGSLKDFCKHHPDVMNQHVARMASTLCPILGNNDSNIRLKRHAERAMKYLLGISYHSTLTDAHFISSLQMIQASNADNARFLRDYSKRMLSKLSEESDDNW